MVKIKNLKSNGKPNGKTKSKPQRKQIMVKPRAPQQTPADKCLLGYALSLANPWSAPPISLPIGGSPTRLAVKRYKALFMNLGGANTVVGFAITSFENETQFQTYTALGVVTNIQPVFTSKGRLVAAGIRCSYGGRNDDFGGISTRTNCNTEALGDSITAAVDTQDESAAYRVLKPNDRCVSHHYYPIRDEDGGHYPSVGLDSACARISLAPNFSTLAHQVLVEYVVIIDCDSTVELPSYSTANTLAIAQVPSFDLPQQTRAISRPYTTGAKEISHVPQSRHHQSYISSFTHGVKEIADAGKHVAEAVGTSLVTYGTYKAVGNYAARSALPMAEEAGGLLMDAAPLKLMA